MPALIALALAESLLWAGAAASEEPRHASAWVRGDAYRYIDIGAAVASGSRTTFRPSNSVLV